MPASPAVDPMLKRFRAALDALYGDRIERVVLYGSRARGDAQKDSDYDVAVSLKSLTNRWQEVDRIVPLVTDILYEEGAFIHAMPHRAGSYEDRTSLMREIRREGIDLAPEAKGHFDNARQGLTRARAILAAGIGEDAG